jgi:hypothetical protein
MKFLRAAFVVVAAVFFLTGCLQVERVVKLKPDGSGTIEETVLIPKAALATLQQMGGGAKGKSLDIFDEGKLKQEAAKMGEGVTYVSGKKVSSDAGEGFTATYAFTDVNKLKLDQNLADSMPGPTPGGDQGRKPEPVVFHFAKGSPAVLTVTMPAPEFKPKAEKPDGMDDVALQMMQQMLKDMKMTFALEVQGTISETNATYRDGGRVTLMEMDFNKVLSNPEKFKAMAKANPQTMQEAKAILKEIDGIKVETSPEVKIKFQ